jgi:hypothetical protein
MRLQNQYSDQKIHPEPGAVHTDQMSFRTARDNIKNLVIELMVFELIEGRSTYKRGKDPQMPSQGKHRESDQRKEIGRLHGLNLITDHFFFS